MKLTYSQVMSFHNRLKPIWEYPFLQHEYIVLSTEISPNDRVLDVGSGEGKLYKECLLPNGFSGTYVGVDDDVSLRNLPFKLYKTVDEVIQLEERFDVVMMMNFIEHISIDDFLDLMDKVVQNLLKPQSKIIIMTPNSFSLDYLFKDPYHKTFYAYDVLYGILRGYGFENLQIWRTAGYGWGRSQEWNNKQVEICKALFLDWIANVLVVGVRKPTEKTTEVKK